MGLVHLFLAMTYMHYSAMHCVPQGLSNQVLQVNLSTAALGAGNIGLYTAIYTPLKQIHPLNTWVGAIVGAIPPLMGWTAVTNSLDPGALFLGGVLYLWQLPHFMSLAWMCKTDYIKGGYKMLSFLDQSGRRTAGVALRNALAMIPIGLAAVHLGLTNNAFAYESVALSGLFALTASAFYMRPCQQVCPAPGTQLEKVIAMGAVMTWGWAPLMVVCMNHF
jgi:heme o synthase